MLPQTDLGFAFRMYHSAGLAPTPLAGKKPILPLWPRYYNRAHTPPEAPYTDKTTGKEYAYLPIPESWCQGHSNGESRADGLGLVMGWQSGNLFAFDFESAEAHASFLGHELIDGTALGELVSKAWCARTPRGGVHLIFKLAFEVPGNTPFAKDPAGKLLIESRGQGGQIACPMSVDSVPLEKRAALAGQRFWEYGPADADEPATLDKQQFELLCGLCREQDQTPAKTLPQLHTKAHSGVSIFDSCNNAPSFQQRALGALEGAGWRVVGTKGDGVYLCRPGKESGVSASWGICRSKIGAPLLKVFSSSTAFDTDYAHSPFDVVCLIQHGGSKDALLAELRGGEFDDSPAQLPKTRSNSLTKPAVRELGSWVPDAPRCSEIDETDVEWLWPNKIPLGMLSVLEGPPGIGKSTIAVDVMARLSRGRSMPFEPDSIVESGNSIIIGPEDPVDSVAIPRLRAADANLARVRYYKGLKDPSDKKQRFFLDPMQLTELEKFIVGEGVRFVFIDAVMSILPSKSDSNSDASMRSVLDPLAEMADRSKVAVMIGRHWAKGAATRSAHEKGLGSIAFSGVSRSVLQCAMHPTEPNLRVFAVGKGSLADPSLPALGYGLNVVELEGRNGLKQTTKVEWQSQLEGFDIDSLGRTDPSKGSSLKAAISWITERLADVGELKSKTLETEAAAAGFGKTAVESAKTKLKAEGKIRYQRFGLEWIVIATQPATPSANSLTP